MSKKYILSTFLAVFACTPAIAGKSGRTAVFDCRAGCQGQTQGCQESLMKSARIDAAPGKYFDTATVRVIKQWNASDSPGLVRVPDWNIERIPENSANPKSLIVSPVVTSCQGKSGDTQGVTFYEITADYF